MNDTRTLTVNRSTATAHRLAEYDGVCGELHGHNLAFEAEVEVDMANSGKDNMPIDLKSISAIIDQLDHKTVLSQHDPLVELGIDLDAEACPCHVHVAEAGLGDVIAFDGDPTCEAIVEWVAEEIYDNPAVRSVELTLHETESYSVTTSLA